VLKQELRLDARLHACSRATLSASFERRMRLSSAAWEDLARSCVPRAQSA
jgi:hypothetical protein